MHQNSSTSTVDKTRNYTDTPSPLAMTPEEFHTTSIQTAELAAAYYADRPSKPVYTAPTREVLERLRTSSLPEQGMSAQEILTYFAQEIMPYDMGNQQPTFSPWVNPAAAPISIFMDHLASVMNPTSAKGLHAATEVEKLVIRWLEELIGFPTVGSGGIFLAAAARRQRLRRPLTTWDSGLRIEVSLFPEIFRMPVTSPNAPASMQVPDAAGRFGAFGGRYVPETLTRALDELTREYERARQDRTFTAELDDLFANYVGRPSPLYFARRLTEQCGGGGTRRAERGHRWLLGSGRERVAAG